MGLTPNQITLRRTKRMVCDYCGTPMETGIYSELGDFCSVTCEALEQADRSDLYYDSVKDDLSLADQEELKTDMAIDLEREKDME